MGTKHVVIWDPSGEYWEGGLVDQEAVAPLKGRGVALLPVEEEYVGRTALGGWTKRSWGSGWPLSTGVPRMICPVMLYVVRGDGTSRSAERLNVVVRLVPEGAEVLSHMREGGRLSGSLRVAADSGQPGAQAGGVSTAPDTICELSKLGKPDEDDGWTVYLGARINSPVNGLLALSLYGSSPGLRVAWAAASQSR